MNVTRNQDLGIERGKGARRIKVPGSGHRRGLDLYEFVVVVENHLKTKVQVSYNYPNYYNYMDF